MPTALANPWPNGPVVVSTPGVWPYSGWPGVLLPHWRKCLMSSSVTSYPVRYSTLYRSIDAWPHESTKRSRLGQSGCAASYRKCLVKSRYASGASAIGVPGCPEFACCTASMDSVRTVLMHNSSRSDPPVALRAALVAVSVMSPCPCVVCDGLWSAARGGSARCVWRAGIVVGGGDRCAVETNVVVHHHAHRHALHHLREPPLIAKRGKGGAVHQLLHDGRGDAAHDVRTARGEHREREVSCLRAVRAREHIERFDAERVGAIEPVSRNRGRPLLLDRVVHRALHPLRHALGEKAIDVLQARAGNDALGRHVVELGGEPGEQVALERRAGREPRVAAL